MKLWLGIGGGCLLLAIVACLGSWWWCKSKAEEAAEGLGNLGGEMNRISLSFSLSTIKASCMSDPSGAGAANSIHPAVFPQLQGVVCQVNDQTVSAFGSSCNSEPQPSPCSTVQPVAVAGDGQYADAVGIPQASCWTYTSGSAKIVGCNAPEGGFKIVHMENPAAVQ